MVIDVWVLLMASKEHTKCCYSLDHIFGMDTETIVHRIVSSTKRPHGQGKRIKQQSTRGYWYSPQLVGYRVVLSWPHCAQYIIIQWMSVPDDLDLLSSTCLLQPVNINVIFVWSELGSIKMTFVAETRFLSTVAASDVIMISPPWNYWGQQSKTKHKSYPCFVC